MTMQNRRMDHIRRRSIRLVGVWLTAWWLAACSGDGSERLQMVVTMGMTVDEIVRVSPDPDSLRESMFPQGHEVWTSAGISWSPTKVFDTIRIRGERTFEELVLRGVHVALGFNDARLRHVDVDAFSNGARPSLRDLADALERANFTGLRGEHVDDAFIQCFDEALANVDDALDGSAGAAMKFYVTVYRPDTVLHIGMRSLKVFPRAAFSIQNSDYWDLTFVAWSPLDSRRDGFLKHYAKAMNRKARASESPAP